MGTPKKGEPGAVTVLKLLFRAPLEISVKWHDGFCRFFTSCRVQTSHFYLSFLVKRDFVGHNFFFFWSHVSIGSIEIVLDLQKIFDQLQIVWHFHFLDGC